MVLPFRPAKFDRDISTLGISGFAETLAEGSYTAFEHSRRFRAKISDNRHRRLLCMGRKRPRCGRGSAEGDKLAPPHIGHWLFSALAIAPCGQFTHFQPAAEVKWCAASVVDVGIPKGSHRRLMLPSVPPIRRCAYPLFP